jgi:hypothetical protein
MQRPKNKQDRRASSQEIRCESVQRAVSSCGPDAWAVSDGNRALRLSARSTAGVGRSSYMSPSIGQPKFGTFRELPVGDLLPRVNDRTQGIVHKSLIRLQLSLT